MDHQLKILPKYYGEIISQRKTFEIRKDDRNYQIGDTIILKEFDGGDFTGNSCKRKITYILRDAKEYGLAEGYCILGLQPVYWMEYKTILTENNKHGQ